MIETGIRFGNVHSFNDLDLILSKVEIDPATPKTTYVDIPGGDGSLDLTEALGEVKYMDRVITATLSMNPSSDLSEAAWEQKKTQVSNALDGLACHIVLDKDPGYYWVGRCTVDAYRSQKRLRQFVISARVRPYKNKMYETVVPVCLEESQDLIETHVMSGFSLQDVAGTPCYMVGRLVSTLGGYPEVGKKYKIHWDGSDYVCTAYQSPLLGNDAICLGNEKMLTEGVIEPVEPFAFIYNTTDTIVLILAMDTLESHTVGIDGISAGNIVLENARKSVCPVITCTAETTVVFGDSTFKFSAGTHKDLGIRLKHGKNNFTISGTGDVTFRYQEADL